MTQSGNQKTLNILHLAQAIDPTNMWGGAEYTDSILMRMGVERGHNIFSINARMEGYEWATGERMMVRDLPGLIENRIHAVILCNTEWFHPETLKQAIERAIEHEVPIIYHPHHFTPCRYIGLPGTTEELCESQCGGLFACQSSYRYHFYKWILQNASTTIYLSPLQRETFLAAYGDDVDYGYYHCCPPPISKEFSDFEITRMLDAVTVGGGRFQKGILNHIAWLEKNPDRTLDIWGKIDIDPHKLPARINYKGTIGNKGLPNVLNLYKSFVYYPACQEAYGRVIAEAALCGCEMLVDTKKIGACSYDTPPEEHQDGKGNGFWDAVEDAIDVRKPHIALDELLPKDKLQRVVITTTTGMGNIVMMLPMVKAIMATHPDVEVYFIEEAKSREVLDYEYCDNPNFHLISKVEELPQPRVPGTIWIKPAVCCDNRYDSAMLAYASNYLYNPDFDWATHDVDRHMWYAKELGAVGNDTAHLHRLDKFFDTSVDPIVRGGIGVAIGYSKAHPYWTKKHWGDRRFAKLCVRMATSDDIYLIVGDEADAKNAEDIIAIANELDPKAAKHITTFGPFDHLGHYIEFIGSLRLVVGNDTGFAHIARAVGVKAITIFGPTLPNRSMPYGYDKWVVKPSDGVCQACQKVMGSQYDTGKFTDTCDHICMESITVSDVLSKVALAIGGL